MDAFLETLIPLFDSLLVALVYWLGAFLAGIALLIAAGGILYFFLFSFVTLAGALWHQLKMKAARIIRIE